MIRAYGLGIPHRVAFSNGSHSAVADLPAAKGGAGLGFGPHDLLEAALATCMAITVEMYAAKHGIPLESVAAEVRLDRTAPDAVEVIYSLTFGGPLTEEQRESLRTAASRCPVQRTLAGRMSCREG